MEDPNAQGLESPGLKRLLNISNYELSRRLLAGFSGQIPTPKPDLFSGNAKQFYKTAY